jgi:hypothetical protein
MSCSGACECLADQQERPTRHSDCCRFTLAGTSATGRPQTVRRSAASGQQQPPRSTRMHRQRPNCRLSAAAMCDQHAIVCSTQLLKSGANSKCSRPTTSVDQSAYAGVSQRAKEAKERERKRENRVREMHACSASQSNCCCGSTGQGTSVMCVPLSFFECDRTALQHLPQAGETATSHNLTWCEPQ